MKKNSGFSSQGQSLIEFGLLIPILLLLLFVIIDLGRIIYVFSALQNSAREGARYGVIEPLDTSGIENRVRRSAAGLNQNDLLVTMPYDSDDTIQVRVQYRFRMLTPVIPSIFGLNVIQLNARATMHIEK